MGGDLGAHTSVIRVHTSVCALQDAFSSPVATLSTCRRAASAQAVRVRVRTARASGGATGNAHVALAAARRSGLREDTVRGQGRDRRLPVLSANTRAQQLGLMERCSKERVI